ncbi:hypothetical protein GCM10009678_24510 [Actinomadura kijaniata]|uniref:Uncharacterized protein n=1 Tax=Actinomadura namibiensis TaxID=182080 RepID=A0A7W3LP84_ACTNM|nr:hypothetical protein [Actinomadura namibiensis]MBA8951739.1 hypothetical protein [Actinomadura namibiensis]
MRVRPGCGRLQFDDGALRTRVTYGETGAGPGGWAVVTVERHNGAAEAFAPAFLPDYLRTSRITDGGVHLPHTATELDEDTVGYFLPDLTERRRSVPLVAVAATPQEPGAARARAEGLARAVAGAAAVVWFADLAAQDRFNAEVGDDLAVYGGGVRTYLPGLSLEHESYPSRHRVMGGATLRRRGARALDIVAGHVLGQTAPRRLPDDVRAAHRMVGRILAGLEPPEALAGVTAAPVPTEQDRERLRRALLAMVPAPRPTPARPAENGRPAAEPPERPPAPALDPDALADAVASTVADRLRDEIMAALELAAARDRPAARDELLRQMRTMNTHIGSLSKALDEAHSINRQAETESDRLEDQLERLREANGVLELELEEAAREARHLTERVRRLEARLAETRQDFPNPAGLFEPTHLVDALYHARETLPFIEIGDTFDTASALDLGYPGQCARWAAKAWDAFQALNDFAAARSSGAFHGGFYDWCRDDTGGRRVIPTTVVSLRESTTVTTRDKLARPRVFPVPTSVNPKGRQYMPAHIKLRRVGSPAPRIHFHDDSAGTTGKVWIGYVGDHLPNTRTN